MDLSDINFGKLIKICKFTFNFVILQTSFI
jgi:hypothetical protein